MCKKVSSVVLGRVKSMCEELSGEYIESISAVLITDQEYEDIVLPEILSSMSESEIPNLTGCKCLVRTLDDGGTGYDWLFAGTTEDTLRCCEWVDTGNPPAYQGCEVDDEALEWVQELYSRNLEDIYF